MAVVLVFNQRVLRKAFQHSVHPTSGTLRVFKHFVWLEVDSAKIALSRPAHLPVTQAVGRQSKEQIQNRL
jgi:hypothetical protein